MEATVVTMDHIVDRAVVEAPEGKMPYAVFYLKAIDTIVAGKQAAGQPYKGAHTVFDGVNAAHRKYYCAGMSEEDTKAHPVLVQKALVAEGIMVSTASKGGSMIYRNENAPQRAQSEKKANSLLAAIAGE